jgi:hypothetical protein
MLLLYLKYWSRIYFSDFENYRLKYLTVLFEYIIFVNEAVIFRSFLFSKKKFINYTFLLIIAEVITPNILYPIFLDFYVLNNLPV